MSRWPAAPTRPFARVAPRVACSPWARAALTDQDIADLEERAAAKETVVGIVKRRDGLWLGRAGGEQAIGRTAFDAGRMALERLDCE